MAPNQEFKPKREYSNKYVEFLHHWDRSQRRLKKQVAGPPENYQHPNAIHGQRVPRLGRGIPPSDNQEQEFRAHRRRLVANKSFQSHPDLLCPSRPSTAPAAQGGSSSAAAGQLFLCETRQRTLQGLGGRGTASSLKGAGALVTAEAEQHKPWRGRGSANPGHGLSPEMVKTLTFDAEAKPVQQQQRLVWSVALSPRTAAEAGLQQDEAADAPRFDVQRAMTPNLQACSAEERRTVFYGSLKDYAKNKVVGDLGSLKLGTGLRALAGLAR